MNKKLLFILTIAMLFIGFFGYYLSSESYQIRKSQKKIEYLIETGKKILIETEKYRENSPEKYATNFEFLQLQLGKDFEVYPGYVEYKKGKDKFLFMLDYSNANSDLLLVANYSQIKSVYDAFQLVISKNYKEVPAKITVKCKAPVNWEYSCKACASVGEHLSTGDWCWYKIK